MQHMTNQARTALIGFLLAFCIARTLADTAESSPATIADLGWLAGCWSLSANERTVREQWMPPDGDALLGMSRTVAAGRTLEYEFVRIVARDGTLVYVAQPSGQPEASFRMRSSGPREVVFENPEHDFPQRIGYRSASDDALTAWIEGKHGDSERRIEFPYHRVACH